MAVQAGNSNKEDYIMGHRNEEKRVYISFEDYLTQLNKNDYAKEGGLLFHLGVNDSRLSMRLNNESPHLMVSGNTGSGKSNLLRQIVLSLLHNADKGGVRFCCYTGRMSDLGQLAYSLDDKDLMFNNINHTLEELDEFISKVSNMVFKRQKALMDMCGCEGINFWDRYEGFRGIPPVVVVMDNCFTGLCDNGKGDPVLLNYIIETLIQLMKVSATFGVQFVFSSSPAEIFECDSFIQAISNRASLWTSAKISETILGTDVACRLPMVGMCISKTAGKTKTETAYNDNVVWRVPLISQSDFKELYKKFKEPTDTSES